MVTRNNPSASSDRDQATRFQSLVGCRLFGAARLAGLVLALLLIDPMAASSLSPEERLDDPELEARARALSAELRCVVCPNQSIDDSNAPLAQDLRQVVRERLIAGDTNAQALAYITTRYGDYVLLRPPMQPNTVLLWGGPALALVFGGVIVAWVLARRKPSTEPPDALTPEERRRIDALLGRGTGANADAEEGR